MSDKIIPFPPDNVSSFTTTADLPVGVGLDLSFGDPETLLNSRDWLRKACEAQGAKFTGGGCGFGQADIDIELEGMAFNVSIRPILRQP